MNLLKHISGCCDPFLTHKRDLIIQATPSIFIPMLCSSFDFLRDYSSFNPILLPIKILIFDFLKSILKIFIQLNSPPTFQGQIFLCTMSFFNKKYCAYNKFVANTTQNVQLIKDEPQFDSSQGTGT